MWFCTLKFKQGYKFKKKIVIIVTFILKEFYKYFQKFIDTVKKISLEVKVYQPLFQFLFFILKLYISCHFLE